MPTILGANSVRGNLNIDNSLRFNDGDSPDLKRLPSATGQSIKGSLSVWVKFSNDNTEVAILGGFDNSGADDNDGYLVVKRIAAGNLEFAGRDTVWLKTTQLLRDTSAWYHIVLGIDTSLATADDRQKLYINGVQVTSFATRNNATRNQDFPMNTTAGNDDALLIGADEDTGGKGLFFDGYMADFYWIDQGQKEASDFGEFNNDGVWVPTAYTGAFGVNGVHLEFKGTGTSADSSGIGADTSGNDLHFTVTNLAAIDVTTDTCTNNFATINSLANQFNPAALSEGNTRVDFDNGTSTVYNISNIGVASGKWYCEVKTVTIPDEGEIGIASRACTAAGNNDKLTFNEFNYGYTANNGNVKSNNTGGASYGDSYNDGDIIGIALDLDNNKLYFSKNGTFQNSGDPTTGSTGTGAVAIEAPSGTVDGVYYFAGGDNKNDGNTRMDFNFGNPAFALDSGNADADGHGDFEFAVPSGYFALCTKNLAEYGG